MRKIAVYSVALLVCLIAGCKKDKPENKIYLLKEQLTDYRSIGGPIDTVAYTYDDQNRIININDGQPPRRSLSVSISYDNSNRISTARKYNNDGGLIIEYDFFYTPAATGYYFYNSNIADTANFTFNEKRQVIKIQSKHSGSEEYTYDSKGNIIVSEAFRGDGSNTLNDKVSYVYDDKKNPFSQTLPNNYFFMFIAFIDNHDVSSLVNNVVVRNADTYNYTYNSIGFPISGVAHTGTATIPIRYNYLVK